MARDRGCIALFQDGTIARGGGCTRHAVEYSIEDLIIDQWSSPRPKRCSNRTLDLQLQVFMLKNDGLKKTPNRATVLSAVIRKLPAVGILYEKVIVAHE